MQWREMIDMQEAFDREIIDYHQWQLFYMTEVCVCVCFIVNVL